MRMPSSAYIVTGGICAFMALVSFFSNAGIGTLFFGVGAGINTLMYRNAVERERRDNQLGKFGKPTNFGKF